VQWQSRRWTEDAWTDIPGATSDSYTSPPASVNDVEPGFRAVFTNSAGSVATQSADLRVNQAPPAAGTPSAPRNVKARQTAPGQITITWSAPSDEGSSPITSYGAGYGTRRWGNGDDFSPSTFKAVFNGIDDGDYTAVVFAVNDTGMGWRVFVPISVGDVPTAPRHLAATRSGSSVTVTWGSPARAGYAPVQGYDVVLTSGSRRLTRTLPADATRATFRDLPAGTWRVTVTATNVVGASSAAAVSVTVPSSTPVAPPRPATRPAAAAIPAVAPAQAPTRAPAAQLALTGSEGAAQAALALGLLFLGLVSTTAARRLRTATKA
jgi:titin